MNDMKFLRRVICLLYVLSSCTQGLVDGPSGPSDESQDGIKSEISFNKATATSAEFIVEVQASQSVLNECLAVVYYSSAEEFDIDEAELVTATVKSGKCTILIKDLTYDTAYKYQTAVFAGTNEIVGEVKEFVTSDVDVSFDVEQGAVTSTSAKIKGSVAGLANEDKALIEVGLVCEGTLPDGTAFSKTCPIMGIMPDNSFEVVIDGLNYGTEYSICSYVNFRGMLDRGSQVENFSTTDGYSSIITDLDVSAAVDLSAHATANSYIVTESGLYKFKTVRGCTLEAVGSTSNVDPVGLMSSCAVLWETFGTSTSPECCDLISAVCYKNDYIAFRVASPFKEGNAVVAALDDAGKILWSWHIWLTDAPMDCTYPENAGVMLDRNLGALSTDHGDPCALGLLYQWGRKDPFLNSSEKHADIEAKSTIIWPKSVRSDSQTGTIRYAVSNPTVFIGYALDTKDWQYVQDNTRWGTTKTKYDPCPPGYKVPTGGANGIWKKAGFTTKSYDSTNRGISFKIKNPSLTWYPSSGFRYFDDGSVGYVGVDGYYWTVAPSAWDAFYMYFNYGGYVDPCFSNYRSFGFAVRCQKI